jgi:hypothetical protein
MNLEATLLAAAFICLGVGNLALFRMLDAVNATIPAQDRFKIRLLSFNLNATAVYQEYKRLHPDGIEWKVFVGCFTAFPALFVAAILLHLFSR